MNSYVAIWHGVSIEIHADSLYHAKLEAIRQFKPAKSQRHMVSVTLAERADGSKVIHTAVD